MTIRDPASAPPRPDLSFLRHRSRPKAAPATPPPVAPSPATPSPATPSPATPSPATPSPATPSPATPPPAAVAALPNAAQASSSLDLSDTPAAAAPAVARPARTPAPRVHRDRRVSAGEHRVLGIKEPTVTLTRVQSGVGEVEIETVCSPEVGDVRLGAAYQLRDGTTSTVQYAGGNRFAPSSRRPVIVAGHGEYDHLRFDLRQVRELERVAVYAFSESGAELTWGGTLVVTTFGGARVELPLETLYRGRVAVVLSIYNLDGELVVRAEMETIAGDVREAARAYGYDRITWRDARTPVD